MEDAVSGLADSQQGNEASVLPSRGTGFCQEPKRAREVDSASEPTELPTTVNCELIHLFCFKPVNMWSFVMAAIENDALLHLPFHWG